MYQTIVVDGFKDVDMVEVIRAMPLYSLIVNKDPEPSTVNWADEQFREFVSGRVH